MSDLAAAIDAVRAAYDEWQQGDSAVVLWRGQEVDAIPKSIDVAVGKLAETLLSNDFPREEWGAVLEADRFVEAYRVLGRQLASRPDETPPYGTAGLWNRYRAMLEATKRREVKHLEPLLIEEKRGTSLSQMAKMAGFRRANGEPDIDAAAERLKAERAGTAEPIVLPEIREQEEIIAKAWEKRKAVVAKKLEQAEAANLEDQGDEELDDLVCLPNMTAKQIKKMLPGVTDEEIREAAATQGVRLSDVQGGYKRLPLHEQLAQREAEEKQRFDEGEQIEFANTYPELEIDERLLAMSDDGLSPRLISEALERDGIVMRAQEVGKKVRQLKKAAKA